MNELIKISTNEQMEPVISARELHEFLDVGTEFRHWFPRMAEYGFQENVDYTPVIFDHPLNGQPTKDFGLKLDMAKEISMIQRNEKGKEARQYFITVEKEFNSPEKIMARALRIADQELKKVKALNSKLSIDNAIMAPKAEYFDELVDRNLLTSLRDTAKMYGVGEKTFIGFLMEKKYLFRDGKGKLQPYAEKNTGLFEVKESKNSKTGWAGTQTMLTPLGREHFRLLVKGM